MGPSGAHIHFSSDKCRDFSCLVQSYFDLKVSVQKVHWNIRLFSCAGFRVIGGAGRRRLLRSLLPASPELNEPNEPKDCDDTCE